MKIWTIGHFNHPIEDFVQLLTQHDIGLLVDVRRFPGSRTFPQFNCETLQSLLLQNDIDYLWLESLGGRRAKSDAGGESPNEGWRNKSFRNYADHMSTDEFQSGFDILAERAMLTRAAIMCAESVYWRCHRRLVSDYVVAGGGIVEHIFPDGRTKPHTLTDIAKIDSSSVLPQITYPPSQPLFD